MADSETFPSSTREQGSQIREAWANMGSSATYGDITLIEFEAALAKVEATRTSITQLEDRLASARAEHRTAMSSLWKLIKRTRSGVKARYGDDSYEYERFGGTRMSERHRRRTAKATTPAKTL